MRIRTLHKELTGEDMRPSAWHDHDSETAPPLDEGEALASAMKMCYEAGVEDPETDPRTAEFIAQVATGQIHITPKRAWAMRNAATLRDGLPVADLTSADAAADRQYARDLAYAELDARTAARLKQVRTEGIPEDSMDRAGRQSIREEDGVYYKYITPPPGSNLPETRIRIPDDVAPGDLAKEISSALHCGQVDKLGVPYREHPEGVHEVLLNSEEYRNLSPEDKIIASDAAYLHDVVEDTDITFADLKRMGIDDKALAVIDAVTAREGELKPDYYQRVMEGGSAARALKLADLGHNNLPSRRAYLPGSPTVPVPEGGKEQYVKLGKKYAFAYTALEAPIPAHLQEFAN